MEMNYFGKRSLEVLATLKPDLKKIMELSIKRCPVDFGLHEGSRTVERQQYYYDTGKSKINPKKYSSTIELAAKAKHIVLPWINEFKESRAVDFHVSEKHKGKSLAWDKVHLSIVAAAMICCAKELYEKGEVSHLIRWGADWDGDGLIALDHNFVDYPHVELIKP